MIGIFDSGKGGLCALYELRRRYPMADVAFLADRRNAPYGTKTKPELIRLVTSNVKRLKAAGADKILMACCTAGTVYDLLPQEVRDACIPIISPTASAAAAATKNGKIGVIATEATVASHAFSDILRAYPTVKEVTELPLQPLVKMIEDGCEDGATDEQSRRKIYSLLAPLKAEGVDTLVLGCTHFPLLYRTIEGFMSGARLISSAKEGALEMLKYAENKGRSKTLYL